MSIILPLLILLRSLGVGAVGTELINNWVFYKYSLGGDITTTSGLIARLFCGFLVSWFYAVLELSLTSSTFKSIFLPQADLIVDGEQQKPNDTLIKLVNVERQEIERATKPWMVLPASCDPFHSIAAEWLARHSSQFHWRRNYDASGHCTWSLSGQTTC